MHIVDEYPITREPRSPAHAYAIMAGLSTKAEPTYADRRRMRFLARWLCDAAEAAQRSEVAA